KQGQNTSRIEEGSAEKNDQLFALKIVNLPTPFDHYAGNFKSYPAAYPVIYEMARERMSRDDASTCY
ncbi:MAG: hypothetical protein WC612_08460, partial [Bdellovibrionales bacterium]